MRSRSSVGMGNSRGLKSPTVRLQTLCPFATRSRISAATLRIPLPISPRAMPLTVSGSFGCPRVSFRSRATWHPPAPPLPEAEGRKPAQFPDSRPAADCAARRLRVRAEIGSSGFRSQVRAGASPWRSGCTGTEPSERATVTTTDFEAGVLLFAATAPRCTSTFASGKYVAQVLRVHQHHPPLPTNAPVAVFEAVDRGVELIVAPDGRHHQLPGTQRLLRDRVHGELRSPALRGEATLPWPVGQIEAAGLADPAVVVLEPGNHLLDEVADAVVVAGEPLPVDLAPRAEGRPREPRDDGQLGPELLRDGRQRAPGLVDDPHRILHRDQLTSCGLDVPLRPSER